MKEIKRYTAEEKLLLIKEYLSSGESMNSFQLKKGLGHCTLSKWMSKIGFQCNIQQHYEMTKKTKELTTKSQRELALEAKVIELEKELKKEKLKTLAYNTLIYIAEKEFKFDIRKNFGAKQ